MKTDFDEKEPYEDDSEEDPNSMDLSVEQIWVKLSLGSRTPQTEEEQEWLDDINKAKEQGQEVDIPFLDL